MVVKSEQININERTGWKGWRDACPEIMHKQRKIVPSQVYIFSCHFSLFTKPILLPLEEARFDTSNTPLPVYIHVHVFFNEQRK